MRAIRRYLGAALVIYVIVRVLGVVMEPMVSTIVSLLIITLLISWTLRFR